MIETARTWWAARSVREQTMLSIMAAALALVGGWFGVISPILSSADRAEQRYGEAVTEISVVKAKASELKSLISAPPAPLGMPVSAFVSQTAIDAGFKLARLDPVGTESVAIAIDSAKSPALFAWITVLSGRGIFVKRLTVRTNDDATIKVDATFSVRES